MVVRLYGELYEAAGRVREVELEVEDGATVLDAARLLEQRFSGLRGRLLHGDKLSEDLVVLVNGRNIDFLEGAETRLRDGDRVAFFPPAGGG